MLKEARSKYTREQLEKIVLGSRTWKEVCLSLGLHPFTGSQTHIKKVVLKLGIDVSHFVGKSYNKGRSFPKKDALAYCFYGSSVSSHSLKQRLIRDGYKQAKCEICGTESWRDETVPLELDHKDSNHWNNEIENLQIICPNCHALETRRRSAEKSYKRRLGKCKYIPKKINGVQAYIIRPKKTKEELSAIYSAGQKKRYSNGEFKGLFEERVKKVLESGIDFSKFGWVGKVSDLLGVSHTQVRRFMLKYLPELYTNVCFQRYSVQRNIKKNAEVAKLAETRGA